jgi:hypothetical protein
VEEIGTPPRWVYHFAHGPGTRASSRIDISPPRQIRYGSLVTNEEPSYAVGEAQAPEHVFKAASIRGEDIGLVKKLPGYKKNHHVPDEHFPAAEAFIRRIGHEEVEQLATRLHEGLRATFGFKRKEIMYDCADGTAVIKTPDFEVNLFMDQDPADAGQYRLVTEVSRIRQPELVLGAGFSQLFSRYCNTVVVAFSRSLSVEEKIDLIEELPALEPHLSYEPDSSSLTLKLPEIHVFMDANGMTLSVPGSRDLQDLLAHAQSALNTLSASGVSA